MHILVVAKMVPDLVEELTVDASGTALDTSWLRQIVNEPDNHAIEQAILLKERGGGSVTVVAPDAEGADEMLFAAAAKGADRLIKLSGSEPAGNRALAAAVAGVARELVPDLILTGVQAHDDLDGAVGPLLAAMLELPYVGYVAGAAIDGGSALVRKEFPGGLVAEMRVSLPAVLGVQAAEQPPRYVAISKIRQAMGSSSVDEREWTAVPPCGPEVARMHVPETGSRAAMLEGDENAVAARLVDVLREAGVL